MLEGLGLGGGQSEEQQRAAGCLRVVVVVDVGHRACGTAPRASAALWAYGPEGPLAEVTEVIGRPATITAIVSSPMEATSDNSSLRDIRLVLPGEEAVAGAFSGPSTALDSLRMGANQAQVNAIATTVPRVTGGRWVR